MGLYWVYKLALELLYSLRRPECAKAGQLVWSADTTQSNLENSKVGHL